MKRKKVAITFAYLQNNLGDDLFVEHLCKRYPNVDFYVMQIPQKNETLFKLSNLHLSKKMQEYFKFFQFPEIPNKVIKFYNDFDACLMIGGSIFMQKTQNWYASAKNFKNRMALNKNSFVIGANFGPFKDPNFLINHTNTFRTITDICFRDSTSASFFPTAENVRYCSDILFDYKFHQSETENFVGISIINGYFPGRTFDQVQRLKTSHDAYVDKIVELCSAIVKKGLGIKLFSFCKPQWDLRVAEIIEGKCLKNGVTNIEVCSYEGNCENFLKEFSSARAIVATRFHAMILGFLFGKPVYPIIYDAKQKYVLQDLNFYGKTSTFENFSSENVSEIVDCLLNPSSKNSYETNKIMIEKAIENATQQFSGLDKILKGNGE